MWRRKPVASARSCPLTVASAAAIVAYQLNWFSSSAGQRQAGLAITRASWRSIARAVAASSPSARRAR